MQVYYKKLPNEAGLTFTYIRSINVMLLLTVFLFPFWEVSALEMGATSVAAFIKAADSQKYRIPYPKGVTQDVIGYLPYENETEIARPATSISFSDAMIYLGRYFTEDAAKTELAKIGLYPVDGSIGIIMADGETVFIINSLSTFELISDTTDSKVVRVRVYDSSGGIKTPHYQYYYLESAEGNWKIAAVFNADGIITINGHRAYVWASSVLSPTSHDTYGWSNIFDQDPRSAWVEGVPGNGIDEWVEFVFLDPVTINQIEIVNGYTKNQSIYKSNNRVRSLEVSFTNGEAVSYMLQDNVMESQCIRLVDSITTTRIRFTIKSVYPGAKYNDTCISELALN